MLHTDFDDDYPEGITDPYLLYSNPDYVPPVSNLIFGIGIVLIGLCLMAAILFAIGSALEWGASIAAGLL